MDAQALETEAQSAISGAATAAELEEARVRYLGRKSELAQALRGGARPRDRDDAQLAARPARDCARGAARGARARRARPRADRGGRRRHAARRRASARAPAPDHAGAAPDRGRLPRPRLRDPRRPRGRDGRVQLRQARLRPVAPGALAPRDVLLRRRPAAAHRDLAEPDPRARGARAADLHGLDRPLLPARRRSTRRTTRSSTSSRASPSTAG